MATEIESGKEYEVKQGSTVAINTNHSTPGSVQFALQGSSNFGTASALTAGINLFQNIRGKYKVSGFSGGTFMESDVTPTR